MTVEYLQAHLGDRLWRLNNLYYIKNKEGEKVLFKLNAVQQELHTGLWFFNIVPKARQLGVTTFFAILYFDQILFSENKTAGIIAHRQEDMKKIFRNNIRFAWENLHPWLRNTLGEPNTDTAYELRFSNGSSIFVSMSTRSGTVQFLHISEFGYICQRFPEKAEEIVTGAINSVERGQMVSIESTAAGREGYFYDFCMDADRKRQEKVNLTELDFKLFFFPWHIEPQYKLEGDVIINEEMQKYFETLETKHGVPLTKEQKNWYVKKLQLNGEKMRAEYPSTLEEAFSVSVEGAYYAKDMNKVYRENRITVLPHDPMLGVETWWDLGINDFNVILLVQTKGPQIRFINMYWNSGEGLKHYYDWLMDQKEKYHYRYDRHVLPHDVEVRELNTGISRKQTLIQMGMRNIVVCPKAHPQDGIDKVRLLFSRFWFDEEKCTRLHESLFNYRKEFDEKIGAFKDKPRHDENSHFADAVRTGSQKWVELIPEIEGVNKQPEQAFFG